MCRGDGGDGDGTAGCRDSRGWFTGSCRQRKIWFACACGDVDSLAHAIGKLVADPVLRKTMGLEGAKIVGEKFSIEKERDQWLNFYKAL